MEGKDTPKKKTRTISLRIDEEVFQYVKRMADDDDRSVNYMIEKILRLTVDEIKTHLKQPLNS